MWRFIPFSDFYPLCDLLSLFDNLSSQAFLLPVPLSFFFPSYDFMSSLDFVFPFTYCLHITRLLSFFLHCLPAVASSNRVTLVIHATSLFLKLAFISFLFRPFSSRLLLSFDLCLSSDWHLYFPCFTFFLILHFTLWFFLITSFHLFLSYVSSSLCWHFCLLVLLSYFPMSFLCDLIPPHDFLSSSYTWRHICL